MNSRLSEGQRAAALASYSVLGWRLIDLARKYGLEVNEMAEEIRTARRERAHNNGEQHNEG